ncbi:hypothetical protein ACOMHN_051329 [Nucella lapillus]
MASITAKRVLTPLFLFGVLVDGVTPPAPNCPASDPYTVFTRIPLDGVIFSQNILFKTSNTSKIECARKCTGQKGCVMMTFLAVPGGRSGICRAYSNLLSLNDSASNATGAVNYRLKDLEGYSWQCGRYLRVTNMQKSYHDGVALCCELGRGQLVMTKTVQDRDCVNRLKTQHGFDSMWVGADDIQREGQYRWRDGTSLSKYSPVWDKTQPYDAGDADCMAIWPSGAVHDVNCSSAYLVICQKS